MKKLVILGPNQEDPGRVFWETFAMSSVILGVLLFVFATQLFIGQKKQEKAKAVQQALDSKIPESYEIAKRLATHKQLLLDEKHRWTYEELSAALNHGPKWLSEAACTFVYEDKKQPVKPLTDEQMQSLEKMVVFGLKKHIAWAPHACMLRAHLGRKLLGMGSLEPLGKILWLDFYAFRLSYADTKWILEQYRTSRRRPAGLDFYHWLRYCGLRYGIVLWHDCIRMLRQISPSQGYDFVDMIDHHLVKDTITESADVDMVTRMYGLIIKRGYPYAWTPINKYVYPNYDRDARITSTLQLCRMLNSPNALMVDAAAMALSEGVGIKARAKTRVDRWRMTCLGVFGGQEIKPPVIEEEESPAKAPELQPDKNQATAKTPATKPPGKTSDVKPKAPNAKVAPKDTTSPRDEVAPKLNATKRTAILAVWSGHKEDLPDYSLSSAIKAGHCQKGLRPAWRCVGAYWSSKDSVKDHMRAMFIKTRYIEQPDLWQTPSQIVRARPEKTLPRKMMNMNDWKATRRPKEPTPRDTVLPKDGVKPTDVVKPNDLKPNDAKPNDLKSNDNVTPRGTVKPTDTNGSKGIKQPKKTRPSAPIKPTQKKAP